MSPSYSQIGAACDGITKQMVAKHKKAGMPVDSIENSVAWYRARPDLSRTKRGRIDRVQTPAPKQFSPPAQAQLAPGAAADSSSAVASPGVGDQAGSDLATNEVDENTQAYRQDRARNERIKADRGEIELKQLRRELVPVSEVELLEFTAGRIVRDRLEQLPPRAAADLRAVVLALIPEEHRAAVAVGLELHTFENRLAALVREALADASKAIEASRREDDEPD